MHRLVAMLPHVLLLIASMFMVVFSFKSHTPIPSVHSVARQRRRNCSCSSSTRPSNWNITILSQNPRVFYIHDFLTQEECASYIEWAQMRAGSDGMTRSNPPSVSLDLSRLWPLSILCLLAGVPSSIRFIQQSTPVFDVIWIWNLFMAILPTVLVATIVSSVICISTLTLVRMVSDMSSRTSEAISLNSIHDCEFIRPLVERASVVTSHSWEKWEAPVVTCYKKGARFASHSDASPTTGSEWSGLGGQRVVTVITYLNSCPIGGGTKFDKLGFTVQPVQGSALVFFPADAKSLVADEQTVHQSLPAVEEKWIVQLFGRVDRVPPPLGIPHSFQPLDTLSGR